MADVRRVQGNLDKLFKKWLGRDLNRQPDGTYIIALESTVVFASLLDWGDGDVVLSVFAPVLHELKPSEALYRYVATTGFVLGNLSLDEDDPSDVTLSFQYRVLANDLDMSELQAGVRAVSVTADHLDNELQPRFGGKRTDQLG